MLSHKKVALHWQILIGMTLGVVLGLTFSALGWNQVIQHWVKPFGTIFINLLKLVAVPLVLFSIVVGITSLTDMSRLSKLGFRAVLLYLGTTVSAVILGLLIVNVIEPGTHLSDASREELLSTFSSQSAAKQVNAENLANQGPLEALVDMFPSNIFNSFTSNQNMLQVIMFAILFGVCIVLLPEKKVGQVKSLFESLSEIVIQMVRLIMNYAPIGVLALLAGLIVDFSGNDISKALELLKTLAMYSISVMIGLFFFTYVFYPLLFTLLTKGKASRLIKSIIPAQLMAFSTSSSAATLPVTLDCVKNRLKVSKETANFILPLGATVNMDGTSLYQAVAAVFISQAYGIDLTLGQQLGIIFTATIASIGAAAVPGAGIIMLIIVLEQSGLPTEGIALILGPDRLLDMLRTVTNVTGDATVASIVDKS